MNHYQQLVTYQSLAWIHLHTYPLALLVVAAVDMVAWNALNCRDDDDHDHDHVDDVLVLLLVPLLLVLLLVRLYLVHHR
jgi:hypothetical protein